jgi:MerR family transcriptional regulator, light-induced transcriptional regulator
MASRPSSRRVWSMSAVTQKTGIGQHTLRAWERRFGFPRPRRLPSGHRRYTEEQIDRLELVARALARGHRAGDVVPLPRASLEALLGQLESTAETTRRWEDAILARARAFDREGIARDLAQACAREGVQTFLGERVAPLLTAIGAAWTEGALATRHEHFLSEILEDTLRTLRGPLERGTAGRPAVLVTLPGEAHSLGMQMAALVVAAAGRRPCVLGAQTPVDEVIAAAGALDAAAAGVSVSPHSASKATSRALAELRAGLPERTALWVGGAGARLLPGLGPGVTRLFSLDALDAELHRLARRDGGAV